MKKLKILMCSQFPLNAGLGGPKGYMEIAHMYRLNGHEVELVGIDQIVDKNLPFLDELWRIHHFSEYLKNYILKVHENFDVIEFEAIYLPLNLKPIVKSILVARNVLLELHLRKIDLPIFKGLKPFLSYLFKSAYRKYQLNLRINQSLLGMKYADIVSVSNPSDEAILIEHGIDRKKILMQPYGISAQRLSEFDAIAKKESPLAFNIAFVGSFDKRKGAIEFPQIIREVTRIHPHVHFKLMGVLGMFRNAESIYQHLGDDLRSKVTIIEKYNPKDLPILLQDCSLGIFPSHLESFGFGVLEMMAMGLPVVGYDSPGISMLILKSLQAPRGKASQMIQLIVKLTENEEERKKLGLEARAQVNNFIYENMECRAIKKYLDLLSQRNG